MGDKEILNLFNAGEREKAFKEIVDSYSERLYWHVRRFLCSHEDTDDLLQEIFMKIWSALPSFRGDSQLYTWIYRIATNEALNFLGKQKVRAALQFESLTSKMEDKIDEDPWFNGDQMQRDLMKAIQKLPRKQRTVFPPWSPEKQRPSSRRSSGISWTVRSLPSRRPERQAIAP